VGQQQADQFSAGVARRPDDANRDRAAAVSGAMALGPRTGEAVSDASSGVDLVVVMVA